MVYSLRLFFSSKCSWFHNSNVFGSCIIHILYTGVLKLKKKFRRQKLSRVFISFRCPLATRILTGFTTSQVSSEAQHFFTHRVPQPPGQPPDSCPHSRKFYGPVGLIVTFIYASPTAYIHRRTEKYFIEKYFARKVTRRCIQGVPRVKVTTSGECSLC